MISVSNSYFPDHTKNRAKQGYSVQGNRLVYPGPLLTQEVIRGRREEQNLKKNVNPANVTKQFINHNSGSTKPNFML